ncbi:MAG: methyltransferase domain-containing protein [Thermoplasmatota archaeon]
MKDGTDTVKRRYDRVSRFYDLFESLMEKIFFSKWRTMALSDLKGKVLEVGVGTGKNLKYYPKDVDLTGIDISSKMLAKAKKKREKIGIGADLKLMDAQNMEFDDGTFNYVVVTFVLCSVPDPPKALQEIRRVLKENGELMALEHVLSKNLIIALWERIHNPITVRLFGFNVDRDTRSNIERSGFKVITDKELAAGDVFRLFKCRVPIRKRS